MKILLGCSTFLGVLFALFLLYAGLNVSGFCFAKIRYLSDEDKFRQEFERLNWPGKVFLKDRQNKEKGGQRYEKIKYESFEQYMESNPNCCAMRSSSGSTSPWDWKRITGVHGGEVTVMNYTIYYLDENGKRRSQKMIFETVQGNCGERWYFLEPSYVSVISTDAPQ
ncbi:MAG: hypothetical protein F6K39_19685 [Okeania sp. SIO3B3]|nr:hypothetical protein [Okeania sp. SIO3B3]